MFEASYKVYFSSAGSVLCCVVAENVLLVIVLFGEFLWQPSVG